MNAASKTFLALAVFASGGIGAYVARHGGDSLQLDAMQDDRASAGDAVTASTRAQMPNREREPEEGIASAGERIFSTNAVGELVVDRDTPFKLDALLAQFPADPSPEDLRRIAEAAKAELQAPASADAVRVLHAYIAYKKDETALLSQMRGEGLTAASELLDRVGALRRQHFSPQRADAMFGLQEAEARFGIEIVRIENDSSQVMEEKLRRVAALQAAAPPGMFNQHADPGMPLASRAEQGPVSETLPAGMFRLPF
ncbi:MAG TPA: lipase secretion chaperone [Noviherbaspirillum sp.]|nr:lipase secretion chaperone [Noviherbaspirillum sp.]